MRKSEGKGPHGRSERRWEDNIKLDIQEVGCGGRDWMELAQDRDRWQALLNAVMNLRVPLYIYTYTYTYLTPAANRNTIFRRPARRLVTLPTELP